MSSLIAETIGNPSALDLAPATVQEFATRHGLSADLGEAVALAQHVFDVSAPITLAMEEDPDTGENWIEVKVAARGSVENVMNAHENYTERLLSLPTTSCRQIRLFLRIARD